uniref:Uncharacterized protein n=1 Tax=Ditylenchus dipsaci TaxID=166011 RepID=A0A915DQR7_9BILA
MTTAETYPKTIEEFTFHISSNDDFWAFLFNDNAEDKKRRTLLRRMVSVFHGYKEWHQNEGRSAENSLRFSEFSRSYSEKYHVRFDSAMLNQVFCSREVHPLDIFRSAWAIFEVQRARIEFIPPEDPSVYLDIANANNDLFKQEKFKLEDQANKIALYGDRLYTLLGKGKSIKVTELIEVAQKGVEQSSSLIDCADPIVFIGNIQIYFKDFFHLEIDNSFQNFDIRRVEGRWPSSNIKNIERIVCSPPTYPPMIDLVSPIINGKRKERIFNVILEKSVTPADGIFVQFSSADAFEQKSYVQDELSKLFNYSKLKPLTIIQKGWPCIYDSGTQLLRCKITGKSTSANKSPLAMVECVDNGLITFSEIHQLFDVPQNLLDVPPNGAYIVLTDKDGVCWPMSHPSEKAHWDLAYSKICLKGTKVQAYILDKAPENHYSGRRKSEVFKAQLKIDAPSQDTLIVPDAWKTKKKCTSRKFNNSDKL